MRACVRACVCVCNCAYSWSHSCNAFCLRTIYIIYIEIENMNGNVYETLALGICHAHCVLNIFMYKYVCVKYKCLLYFGMADKVAISVVFIFLLCLVIMAHSHIVI